MYKVCGYSDPFAKTWTKGHWPLDDLWPHICWGLCGFTQGSLCPSPMKIHQSMWKQWPFFAKNMNQSSLTPRWPLTPHLLRSHVWLYPEIIVSKSHGNTYTYVDTVINFANYHIHILRTTLHTTYYIQIEWSHSLFLNYVQARQKCWFSFLFLFFVLFCCFFFLNLISLLVKLKVLAIISHFKFHFFLYCWYFCIFRDPSYVLTYLPKHSRRNGIFSAKKPNICSCELIFCRA